jgi:hypothetical protein
MFLGIIVVFVSFELFGAFRSLAFTYVKYFFGRKVGVATSSMEGSGAAMLGAAMLGAAMLGTAAVAMVDSRRHHRLLSFLVIL